MIKLNIIIYFLIFISPCLGAAETCKMVTITGNPEYAPVTFKNKTGEMVGSYIEFTQMVLKELGVESKAETAGNWKRAQETVKKGDIDILAGPWFNESRNSWLDYVQPEISLDQAVIVTKKGKEFKFKVMTDLVGKKGVMQIGNSVGEKFDAYRKENLNIYEVSSWESALKMIARGRVDYAPVGLYSGKLNTTRYGLNDQLSFLPVPITKDNMYIGFSKKSTCRYLAAEMTPVIERFKKDNVLEKLTEKYTKFYE